MQRLSGMTMLAHEYVIVEGEFRIAELVEAPPAPAEASGPDVLPMPWRRIAVGAGVGTLAATTIAVLHSGVGAGAVFATELVITALGLSILGSLVACLSSVATRR